MQGRPSHDHAAPCRCPMSHATGQIRYADYLTTCPLLVLDLLWNLEAPYKWCARAPPSAARARRAAPSVPRLVRHNAHYAPGPRWSTMRCVVQRVRREAPRGRVAPRGARRAHAAEPGARAPRRALYESTRPICPDAGYLLYC